MSSNDTKYKRRKTDIDSNHSSYDAHKDVIDTIERINKLVECIESFGETNNCAMAISGHKNKKMLH